MDRLADRLFALPLLAAAMACLVRTYLLLGGRDFTWSGMVRMLHGPATPWAVVFLAVGALCLLGALLFWAGLLPGRPRHPTGAPLFGRDAETEPKGRPNLRRAFLVLPVIAVLVLLADQFPWRAPDGEVASPSQPKANEPRIPGPKTNEPKGNDIASTPPAPEPVAPPAPPPAASPPEAANPPAAPAPPTLPALVPPPVAPTPPEVAVIPPPTVAPLPPAPPSLPTQPEGHRDAVVWLAVAPDGHSIMSASTDHTIKLWDIAGKQLIRNLGVHKDMARTALFMPDGVSALTA
ncbi:WD40 repeat domain-containing protein, partial [Mesorhizobium norvegicum]